MLRSYLKIALRHLAKNKAYTVINILGLAIGMATALLISLWCADQLSFDHYIPNHDRVAEVMLKQTVTGNFLGHQAGRPASIGIGNSLAPVTDIALQKGYDDIFERRALVTWFEEHLVTAGDKSFSRQGVFAQSTLPGIMGFQLLEGAAKSLDDPQSTLISRSLATALFGKSGAVGKTISLDSRQDLRVGGVYEDLPSNSTYYYVNIIMSWQNKSVAWIANSTDWVDHGPRMYVRLKPGITAEQATARIRSIPTSHVRDWIEELLVIPNDKLHLYVYDNGLQEDGHIALIRLFAIVGGFVLLLACINFMNLSTARSEKRAKEVGIRKTVGSLRSQLITQFLSESTLTALLAFILAIDIAWLALPTFNYLTKSQMRFPWSNPTFWIASLAFALFTGILAGSYPAFYLSSFNPIHGFTRRTGLPRKILVVTQFSISLSLIICTAVVFRQIRFAMDRPFGYNRDGLITVGINTDSLANHYAALEHDLLATNTIAAIARSSQPTTGFDFNNEIEWAGQSPEQKSVNYRNVTVSPEFGKTIGWNIKQGRDFSHEFGADSDAMLLNESALKATGFKDPVGRQVRFKNQTYHVIGVVGDMLTNSPFEKIEPAIFIQRGWIGVITIRLRANIPVHSALAAFEPIFRRYNPASPFLYKFNDEDYALKFDKETSIGNIAAIFATLAVLISCLGLFGLASFVAEQRTKEIGIRKVLGAGILSLWSLLSKEFLLLITASMIIAIPLAHYIMHRWLQNYALHTTLSWWIFASAGVGILLITIITVSYQSLKAALMNPVKSLRSE